MKAVLVVVLLLTSLGGETGAQSSGAPPATYKSGADIAAALAKVGAASSSATGADVSIAPGVSVRRRSSGGAPQYAIIHPLSIEIYQITDGSGTLVAFPIHHVIRDAQHHGPPQ